MPSKIQESTLTFVPNKSFGELLDIWSKNFILLAFFNWEFSYIELWFTDKKIARYSFQCIDQIFVKGYGELSLANNMGKNFGKNIS